MNTQLNPAQTYTNLYFNLQEGKITKKMFQIRRADLDKIAKLMDDSNQSTLYLNVDDNLKTVFGGIKI